MKRARLHIKTHQVQTPKYIYAASAVLVLGVFIAIFFYLNIGAGYNAKAVSGTQFSTASLSYEDIAGGTTLGNTTNDNNVYNAIPLGFTFNYNGADFSTVSISVNGFIAMGNAVVNTITPISGTGSNNVISALGGDLRAQSGSSLSYKTEGTAPKRIFTVQWKNYRRKIGSSSFNDKFNFQIRLHETSNIIQIKYGQFEFDESSDFPVQVGLRGNSNTSYHNRTNPGDATNSTNEWTGTSKGTANNVTCQFKGRTRYSFLGFVFYLDYFVLPAEGLTYTYLAESLDNIWLGYTSNWSSSSNWSLDVPSSIQDATIPANPIGGNFPSISTSGNTVRHLTIKAGASLSVNSNRTLSIKGNFLNEGGSSTGDGIIVADNNVLQWVKGKVGNFKVDKGGDEITLNNDIEISGTLNLTKGKLNLNGKTLTISGTVISVDGTITGSNTSDMTITGTGDLGVVYFTSGAQTLRNLTINRAGKMTLGSNLTVTNQLTLTQGTVQTDNNYLSVSNPATTAIAGHGISSYIIGNLRRYINSSGSYDLPLGSNSDYQFANINFNVSSGISYIDAKFTKGTTNPPNLVVDNTQVVDMLDNGYWTISPNSVTSANYDLRMISRGHNNGGIVSGQHTLIKRHDASSPWESLGQHNVEWNSGSGADPITMVRKGLTTFSDYAGGVSTGAPLPVEFAGFQGKYENSDVKLTWATLKEINNEHFEVERASDGINFTSIGSIEGKGTSDRKSNYVFYDRSLDAHQYYYRIKQVDFNLKSSYSKIIIVEIPHSKTDKDLSVQVFPNPTTFDNINVKLESAQALNDFSVSLMAIDGQLVYTEEFKGIASGDQVKLNLNTSVFPKTYLLRIQLNKKKIMKSIIIVE